MPTTMVTTTTSAPDDPPMITAGKLKSGSHGFQLQIRYGKRDNTGRLGWCGCTSHMIPPLPLMSWGIIWLRKYVSRVYFDQGNTIAW